MKTKLFRLQGDLTAAKNLGELKQQILEILAPEPCTLAVDLGDVGYMDSAGLGVLVYAYKRARELGGAVRVHRPQPRVRAVLHMTAMERVFEIVDTPPPDSEA